MRLEPPTDTAVMAVMAKRMGRQDRCLDGYLTATDIAKVAGCSRREVKRRLDEFVATHEEGRAEPGGALLTFGPDQLPDPATQTRAQMALAVARFVGIGRFRISKQVAARAASRPPERKGEKMSSTNHPWQVGKHGRSVGSASGGGVVATLTCSKCPVTESIRFRQLADAGAMDRKFAQRGWATDPARCPDHNRHNHSTAKETKMVTTAAPTFAAPTPAAIAAQAKMFGLLQTHFDPDSGTYGSGYSDAKIAEECRLALDLVVGVRREAFGELRVPNEVQQLTADITALESLLEETIAPIQTELRALKQRVAECCKKFGG